MYKLVGGDQQEYGPVTSDQVRDWIAQGRANGQTIASFDGGPWKPLSTFPEFADALRTASPPPLAQQGPQSLYTGPGAASAGVQTNTMAVTGLVLCVLGICCSPLTLVGIILCAIGLSQIQRNPQAYSTTKVVPIVGLVIGLLSIVMGIIAFSSGAFEEIWRNLPR